MRSNINDSNLTEKEKTRIAAGKAGLLWRACVQYKDGTEVALWKKENMYNDEIMEFRYAMYKYGLLKWVDHNHWKVIHPADIMEVDLFRQQTYLYPDFKK